MPFSASQLLFYLATFSWYISHNVVLTYFLQLSRISSTQRFSFQILSSPPPSSGGDLFMQNSSGTPLFYLTLPLSSSGSQFPHILLPQPKAICSYSVDPAIDSGVNDFFNQKVRNDFKLPLVNDVTSLLRNLQYYPLSTNIIQFL